MAEYRTYIENGKDEIEIIVYYDYQPFEKMTRYYPGCPESVDICYAEMVVRYFKNSKEIKSLSEISLLHNTEIDIETEILESIKNKSNSYYELFDYVDGY
jgi:hypothetical protein